MKIIIAHLHNCPGLPRHFVPRNDDCVGHCELKARQTGALRYQSNIKAFSLVELLISLIIISLIAASFLPVLTKKLSKKETVVLAKNVVADCLKFDNQNRCTICTDTKCMMCNTQINIPEGYYVNPEESCEYKKCAEGCKVCNFKECTICKDNYILNEDKKSCYEDIKYPSEENCKKLDAVFIAAKYNGENGKDLCVTKYNMGDEGLPLYGATVVSVGTRCNNGVCCWKGRTSNECAGAAGFTYSGCNRTVCNFQSAKNTCENYHYGNNIIDDEWELPDYDTLSGWLDNPVYIKNQLQLCDFMTGYGAPQCDTDRPCLGSQNDKCRSGNLWSSTVNSNGTAYDLGYALGKFKFYGYANNSSFSVRCVLKNFKIKE